MPSVLNQEFKRLLKAIDDELETEQQLVIIGGAAILLGYDVPIATRDIDAMNSTRALTLSIPPTPEDAQGPSTAEEYGC